MNKLPKASLKYCSTIYQEIDNELIPVKRFLCDNYYVAVMITNKLTERGYYALPSRTVIMEKS
jgi:hypothetical protein